MLLDALSKAVIIMTFPVVRDDENGGAHNPSGMFVFLFQ